MLSADCWKDTYFKIQAKNSQITSLFDQEYVQCRELSESIKLSTG
jgi:hypothetical protein